MRRIRDQLTCVLLAGVLFAGGCTPAVRPTPPAPLVVAYENGHWFNGSIFEARTMYVQGDRFVERPARTDSAVDLGGGYVVAPFGEAHNHNAEPPRWEAQSRRYMQAGVFHVLNPNSLPGTQAALAGLINRPDAPDVVFAHGGITGPGGHPIGLLQRNIARGVWTEEEGEGAFLFTVASAADLDDAWPALLASGPDLVKVYLLYSEEYHSRLADPATVGWRGMDPALLPDVMQRARSAGLRVMAHVETAADFRAAAAAGVDIIAHMPGFRGDENTALPDASRYRITGPAAAHAARNGTVVVTTLAALAEHAVESGDTALAGEVDRLNRANLAVLQRSGVDIAIGSDAYSGTSVQEALYLATLGVLDHAAVLRAWSGTTPRAIHPGRRIGRLEPGHEASFLVLDGDPLADFINVTRIRSAVKEGQATPGLLSGGRSWQERSRRRRGSAPPYRPCPAAIHRPLSPADTESPETGAPS